MKYEFIETHKADYKVSEICECFSIKPSGYYAWLSREPSARSIADATYSKRIKELHKASKKREGHRMIHDHSRFHFSYSCFRSLQESETHVEKRRQEQNLVKVLQWRSQSQ